MNILITGAWTQAKEHIPIIQDMGHNVAFLQQEKDVLPCDPAWVEGVICNNLFLFHPIEDFVYLNYIQLTSAGTDRAPEAYIQSRRIQINTAKDVYSIPMAEHAVACTMWFYRMLNLFHENQKNHIWEKQRNLSELNGKTVLIIGCGDIGTACAKRFSAFGCRIIGLDIRPRQEECYQEIWDISFLNDLLPKADIMILTVPLTDQTYHLINKQNMGLVRLDSILINISRGPVLDTQALIEQLPRFTGVALDVFEEEPLPTDSPLWDAENVLITPHNSFVGEGNHARLSQLILDNLRGK